MRALMSARCSAVGGWVWARDDKPQKLKAREMMQMVLDLNARSFKGVERLRQ